MKKIFMILIAIICLCVFLTPNDILKADSKKDVKFVGIDSALTMSEKKDLIKINNDFDCETSITFLVHGLGSDASCWSNTLGNIYGVNVYPYSVKKDFQYDPNSIIEFIRRRVNADVYVVDKIDTTEIIDSITKVSFPSTLAKYSSDNNSFFVNS